MKADLHTHSIYSDGFYAPEEVCRRAKINGVELLSITDHDTLNGEEEKRAAAKKYGIKYVTGWEISAYANSSKIHVTGYNCRRDGAYLDFVRRRTELAYARAEESIKKLKGAGICITLEDAKAFRADPDSPLHTMHIARAAAKASGKTPGEVYEELLAPGKIAHSLLGRPTPEEAVDCIHACGGIASVAHPGRIELPFSERERMILALAEYGIDGIEAVYTTHTEEETEYFKGLAKRTGLFVTGGSDTHVESEDHRIGSPLFMPSDELLAALFS